MALNAPITADTSVLPVALDRALGLSNIGRLHEICESAKRCQADAQKHSVGHKHHGNTGNEQEELVLVVLLLTLAGVNASSETASAKIVAFTTNTRAYRPNSTRRRWTRRPSAPRLLEDE